MDKVVFDGKWTFAEEWKQSSLTETREHGYFVIRTAHLDNYIYVMLDAIADTTIDNNKDYALVCFDGKTNQSVKPDSNDYCFRVQLGSNKAFTLQGSDQSSEFKSVGNHEDLIAVGRSSDENDRYSSIPHTSYEFRIPIELLERTDTYGIYLQVFDHSNAIKYTWPSEIDSNDYIPSPAKWGIIYSPDKSLPEYDLPILVLVIGIFSIILLSIKSRRYNLLKIPS